MSSQRKPTDTEEPPAAYFFITAGVPVALGAALLTAVVMMTVGKPW